MAESKKTVKIAKVEPVQSIIYTGPTIENVVVSNTIFNNGMPDHVSRLIEALPVIKNLIVPVERLSATRNEINTKNTPANICYKCVLEYIKKGESNE